MDLTEKSVRKKQATLKMKHLTLLDKVTPVFDNQESLKMRFRLEVVQPLRDVQMRLTIRTETDQAVGTSWAAGRDFLQTGEVTAKKRGFWRAKFRNLIFQKNKKSPEIKAKILDFGT